MRIDLNLQLFTLALSAALLLILILRIGGRIIPNSFRRGRLFGSLLDIPLVLVLEHYLLFVGVVARDSLHFGERGHFELVPRVAVKELSLLLQHLLHRLAHIVIQLVDQGVLLPVFLHLFLNEAERTIDDLLVELQFGLLLVKIFLRPPDLDRVKVEQLILLLEYLEEPLGLHSLVEDLVLDATCQLNLLLVLGLHHLGLLLHLVDLVIEHLYLLPRLLLLLSDGLLDIQVLLTLLRDHAVELLDFTLVLLVLLVRLRDNLVLLGDLDARLLVLLLVDQLDHGLHLLHGLVGRLEPLTVGVLERVQVRGRGSHALLSFGDDLLQQFLVLVEEVQLLDDLSFLFSQQISIVRVRFVLEFARRNEKLVICFRLLIGLRWNLVIFEPDICIGRRD